MGMEQKVTFARKGTLLWRDLSALLARHNLPFQIRMIDGELAFPDEAPPETWRELRVSAAQGMVTLRRETNGIALVAWGNADAALQQFWNALTWAFASATEGTIEVAGRSLTPDEYRQSMSLPESFRE
jgi:hypothetical protein